MFGIGLYELLVIIAVGLMLFSPKELPGVLRTFARMWGTVRRTADEFRDAIMQDEELHEPLKELQDAYRGTKRDLRDVQAAARRELAKAQFEARMAERKLKQLAESAATDEPASAVPTRPQAVPDPADKRTEDVA